MSRLAGLFKTARPLQWVKNLLVFLPLLFAVDLVWEPGDIGTLLPYVPRLAALFAAFCALSSAVYMLNDLADRDADRQHPSKRMRPIASGRVPAWLAGTALVGLAVAGMAGLYGISPQSYGLLLIGGIYLVANVGYSWRLKRVALVDVMIVAGGYVLRAVAGALAVGAAPSPWLYAVTAAGALFIVIGRRYAEARLAGAEPEAQRATLSPLCSAAGRATSDPVGHRGAGELHAVRGGGGQPAGKQHHAAHRAPGDLRPVPLPVPAEQQQGRRIAGVADAARRAVADGYRGVDGGGRSGAGAELTVRKESSSVASG